MANIIKNYRTLVAAGTSNAAGSTTNGAVWDLTTALGGVLTAAVTNGSTGPTVGCDFVVQISGDGTNWVEYVRQSASTAAQTTTYFAIDLPPAVLYARPAFQGNTGQAVVIAAHGQELTAIS
ncbi:MAG: hypothetical protein IRY99_03100 [Isosphaeraceae bacterium]|nr:hypothetical protein [Isosphaeraceae bacterium]